MIKESNIVKHIDFNLDLLKFSKPISNKIKGYIMNIDKNKFIEKISKIENYGYQVEKTSNDLYRVNYSSKNKLHIDIYFASLS